MRRHSIAFAAMVLVSSAASVTACGALKTAATGDGGDGGTDDGTGATDDDEDGEPDDVDGSKPKRDASADATGSSSVPCTDSTCPVETVADGLHGPVAVAVNATHVFWIEVGSTIPGAGGYGQLVRLLKGTGCNDRSCFDVIDPTVLDGELEGRAIYNTSIALGPNDVCYTQTYNVSPGHDIDCFSLTTLSRSAFVQGSGASVGLWVGGGAMRWAIGARGATKGAIRARPLAGGTETTLVPDRADPTSVTSDGTSTFWTERAGAGAPSGNVVVRRPNGEISELAKDRGGPIAAKTFGDYVYWLEYQSRLVMRVRADGTGAPEEIAKTEPDPFALVVDASGVYWASAGAAQTGSEGSVARAPLTPGASATVMMKNVSGVYDVAADAEAIYVAAVGGQLGDGKILRLRKFE